ncbi:MAG: type II toxin-antitoxin system prevent-host-death family antitoxin [Chloroflexi bacterium]|nr:type II toxin-antitoxin system prevent-host-death family antitoxin [Chloroflexota bacterium]MYD64599.1 type II toxin-antitoxin system prevent-host-death family antitoxin [Chloroflexota bacterium]
MALTYSTYEAKARFSEVLRRVRAGETVTVTYRGEPVAEIQPIRARPRTTEERLDELERRGELVPPSGPPEPFRAVMDRPGALEQFLADRDE